MTQETFPEIQKATEALQARIAITETEITQLKETIASKKELLRTLHKALAPFSPPRDSRKKRAASSSE